MPEGESRELAWKTHAPVFTSLNDRVDNIINLLALAHGKPGSVQGVYLLLCGIKQKYSNYFGQDLEEIIKELNICDKALRKNGYLDDLSELKKTNYRNVNKLNKLLNHELKILNLLSKVLTSMCTNFSKSDLFPKPVITKIEKQKKDISGGSM